MYQMKDGRSLGDLFADLSREISTLVQQEIRLAKIELSDKVSQVGKDAASVAVGGVILHAGFLVFLFALVLILDLAIHMLWLSALIVAIVVLAIGAFLVFQGLNHLKHEDVTPHQTIASLRADVDWAKEQTR
jgi:uncharacterized protein YoxC